MPEITAAPILTKHARQRMDEMSIAYNDVVTVLRHPEMDYRAPAKHGGRVACAGEIAVCYRPTDQDPTRLLVTTVLWNRPGDGFVRGETDG
jgi:hypothetical protein